MGMNKYMSHLVKILENNDNYLKLYLILIINTFILKEIQSKFHAKFIKLSKAYDNNLCLLH